MELYRQFLTHPSAGRDVGSNASGAGLAVERVYSKPEA